MQREIKFRAWNKVTKTMIMDVQNMYDGLGKWFDNKGNRVDPYEHLDTSSFGGIIEEASRDGTIDLMQFTGLLDKNGKEIFEGDILRYEDENLSEPAIYVVEFHNGCFISIHQEDEEYNELVNEFDSTTREVIGNIYSNPELLGGVS